MKITSHKSHNLLLRKINPLVRILIVSDMLMVGAMGMFAPLYALFVEESVIDANELVVGMSITIYLLSRSILQIPIATFLDKVKGERDDYFFLATFSVLVGVLYLGFLFVDQVWQLFLMQFLLGLCVAITYPSYMAIFTRHVDKHMEGTEWGVYQTFVDLSTAALATIGGYVATIVGFDALIIMVSILCISGALLLLPLKSLVYSAK